MATLNLDTGELQNESIILKGNSPLNDTHKEILKNYKVIYIDRDFNQSLNGLPSCITAIKYNIYNLFHYKWQNSLNSNDRIRIRDSTLHQINDFVFHQPLDDLHYGLEYLELYGTQPQELRNLPLSLKFLLINWQCRKNSNLEYLPESLEVLYLNYIILSNEGQSHLPRGLKELYLNGGVDGTIYSLPDELQVLYINSFNTTTQLDESTKLPAELNTFIFYDHLEWYKHNKRMILWLFKNKKMPKGLKKCIFPVHYVDIFIGLKEYAKEYITDEIEWKFIDIKPEKLVEHITKMYS